MNGRGPTGKILNPGTKIVQINLKPLVNGKPVDDPSNPGLRDHRRRAERHRAAALPDTDAQLAAAVARREPARSGSSAATAHGR